MKPQDYINLEDELGAHNYKPLDVVLNRGEGIWVWDVEGNKYMDCLSAYSAVNQGHCHPKIMGTMIEQSQILTLTSRAFRNNQLGLLYKELCDLTNSHKVLPMNSGAEAVETVIKAVRKWGYQVKGVPQDQAEGCRRGHASACDPCAFRDAACPVTVGYNRAVAGAPDAAGHVPCAGACQLRFFVCRGPGGAVRIPCRAAQDAGRLRGRRSLFRPGPG